MTKSAIKSSTGGAGFYSNVFVMPKHTGGLCPMLNLKLCNQYMCTPSFKIPIVK